MSPRQKKRFIIVGCILAGVALATFFGLKAFKANIEYFLTPAQIANGEFNPQQRYRIAGLVKNGSLETMSDGVTHRFVVTDCENDVTIKFTGILPDLFREGQAIVANGLINAEKTMIAGQVLAKHDENYVPNEAADAVMKAKANKCIGANGTIEY